MTNTPDKSELKACPFCPGLPPKVEHRARIGAYVVCPSCAAQGPVGGTADIARQHWNTRSRPPADQVPELVERVARAICAAEGRDPDRVSPFIKTPVGEAPDLRHDRLWKNYETAATAAIAALQAVPAASEVGEMLLYGTLSMTKRQVIVDFADRERAEAFFDALERAVLNASTQGEE